MEIYLAGGVTGNLSAYWKRFTTLLSQGENKDIAHKEAMEIYLAGEHPVKNGKDASWEGLNILETFYYLQKNKEFPRLISHFGNFLLDSGAFTFMSGAEKVDFDAYVEEYAKLRLKWNIKHFFELDIDSVVGLKKVERLILKL